MATRWQINTPDAPADDTKPDTAKKPMETSKQIVRIAGIIFAVHIMLSAVLIFLGYGDSAVSLMSACMPVYLSVVAGYFGKAGMENVQKIKYFSDELTNKVSNNG